jgi:Surface lipoprotein assembly modifier
MKVFNNYLLLFCVLLLFFSTKASAQLYLTADVGGYFDDNIFNNYLNTSDFINTFSGELGYDFETENNNLEFYYSGFFNRYYEYADKSTNIQKLGVVNTYIFSEFENPLNVGLNYIVRNNKEEYFIYDYNQISAYANYLHSISESNKIQIGVIGNRVNYENFSIFSNYQFKAFLRSLNSFESRTSLTAAIEFDQKKYIESYESEGLADEILQTKLYLQLGQGITPELGLSGFAFFRKNLNGGNRYVYSFDYVFYEEELFNDIYSSDGIESGLSITYLFLPNIIGKISGVYETRKYTDLPVADEEGNDLDELRVDNEFSIGASLEFGLSKFINGLYLGLNYNYIKNNSNDYFYNYTNQIFAITLGFDF